jgi:hypothetical protein
VRVWTGLNWLRILPSERSCEGNEPSGSIKDTEFLEHMSDSQMLKKDSTRVVSELIYQYVPIHQAAIFQLH